MTTVVMAKILDCEGDGGDGNMMIRDADCDSVNDDDGGKILMQT